MADSYVTVLLPVYNGARFLATAINSVLGQTFGAFELLVINDGSSDHTADVLASCSDPRVRVVEHARNFGLITSLNEGLGLARGEYIARMDADDVALPRRLERQVRFLRDSPGIGLCGTWFRTFGSGRSRIVRPPVQSDDMAAKLFYESPLAHPTVMFRRDLFEKHGLRYSSDCPHAEDFELWTRVALITELGNLPEVLLKYRNHDEQISSVKKANQNESVKRVLLRQLRRIHADATELESDAHVTIVLNRVPALEWVNVSYVESWLRELIRRNDTTVAFPPTAFRRALGVVWWRYCSSRSSEPGVLRAFYSSALTRALPLKNKLGMLAVRAKAMIPRT